MLLASVAEAAPLCMDNSRTYPSTDNSYGSYEMTDDERFIFSGGYGKNEFEIIDSKTGKQIKIPKDPMAYVMANGSDLAIIDTTGLAQGSSKSQVIEKIKNGKIKIVNPLTGKITEKVGVFPFRGGYGKPLNTDGPSLKLQDEKGKVHTFPMDFGNPNSQLHTGKTDQDPSATHDWDKGTLKITKVDGKTFEFSGPEFKTTYAPISFTPDRKYLLISSKDGTSETINVVDLENGNLSKMPVPMGHSISLNEKSAKTQYNPVTGDFILSGTGTLGVQAINLKDKKQKTIAKNPQNGYLSNSYFNKSGQTCHFATLGSYENNQFAYKVQKLCHKPGDPVPTEGEVLSDQQSTFTALADNIYSVSTYNQSSGGSDSGLLIKKENCVENPVGIDCNCELEKSAGTDSNLTDLKSVVLATACSADYDKTTWEKLAPRDANPLSEAQAVIWLKKLSKPDSLDPEKDLSVLVGLLQSNIHRSYPKLTKAALLSIMSTEPRLFNNLVKKFPKVLELKGTPDQDCLTTSEKSKLQTQIYSSLKKEFTEPSSYQDLKQLALFSKDSLNDTQKEQLAESASDRMTELAGRASSSTAGVFSSKIHKFSLYQFKEIMGLQTPDITDFTVVRNTHELRVLQLGQKPFSGSTQSPSGVHLKEMSRIRVDDIKSDSRTEKYKWKYGDREFVGELAIDKIQFDESYIPPNKSPDYKDMWKDKEFRGVVVAGSNLGESLTQSTMMQYVDYYVDKGFEFEPAKENDNMLAYMKDKVSGQGQMDYFIKEAHSGGDEKTMFDIAEKGYVMVGKKKVGDRTEVIELVYPKKGVGKSVAINNSEFGQWARDREKSGGSELLYLNTSCWSESKAIYEIPAAASKKLINIPTTAAITTFVNYEGNIMKELVDGIRQEKDYEGIRTLLRKNNDYATGKSNILLFPDEQAYQSRIVARVRTPFELNSKVSVRTATGELQDYNIGRE